MEFFMLSSVVIFLFTWICFLFVVFSRLNEHMHNKKGLPPGTMGWPFFGETAFFIKQGPNFMKNKRARFGPFFKSHILGSPIVISMEAEVNRNILISESQGLVAGYPQAMVNILGKCNIGSVHGARHKFLRGVLLSLVSSTMLRDRLLPAVDKVMRSSLSNLDGQVIDIQMCLKKIIFNSALEQLCGKDSDSLRDVLMPEFFNILEGTLSLAIHLPGTNYYRALKARKIVVETLSKLIYERKASKETHDDLLGYLMNEEENKHPVNEEEIIDTLITLLNSGFETVSRTSTMAVKYLYDHPKALHEIREENFAIRANKKPEDAITVEEFKSMKFTRAVVLETSRLVSVVNGLLRKTTHDTELNGYLIPKGWRIYVYNRELNYDSNVYSDPYTFNPWRWIEKNLEGKNYFLLFGRGPRLCPGKELGIAEVSTFLHYFVTQYRWEEVCDNKVVTFPRVEVQNGLQIRLSSY